MYKDLKKERVENEILETSANDFATPVVFKKFKRSNPTKPVENDRSKIKRPKKKQITLQQMLKNNYQYSDVNPEHLQMALALSKSSSNITDDGNMEEIIPCSLDKKDQGKKRTLLDFGFNNDDRTVNLREIIKKNPKSKFRHITPILLMRTDEQRESLIQSKICQITTENIHKNFTEIPHVNYSDIMSKALKEKTCAECCIFSLNNKVESKTIFDVSALNIVRNSAKCGFLLKNWSNISCRERTPERLQPEIIFAKNDRSETSVDVDRSLMCDKSENSVCLSKSESIIALSPDLFDEELSQHDMIISDDKNAKKSLDELFSQVETSSIEKSLTKNNVALAETLTLLSKDYYPSPISEFALNNGNSTKSSFSVDTCNTGTALYIISSSDDEMEPESPKIPSFNSFDDKSTPTIDSLEILLEEKRKNKKSEEKTNIDAIYMMQDIIKENKIHDLSIEDNQHDIINFSFEKNILPNTNLCSGDVDGISCDPYMLSSSDEEIKHVKKLKFNQYDFNNSLKLNSAEISVTENKGPNVLPSNSVYSDDSQSTRCRHYVISSDEEEAQGPTKKIKCSKYDTHDFQELNSSNILCSEKERCTTIEKSDRFSKTNTFSVEIGDKLKGLFPMTDCSLNQDVSFPNRTSSDDAVTTDCGYYNTSSSDKKDGKTKQKIKLGLSGQNNCQKLNSSKISVIEKNNENLLEEQTFNYSFSIQGSCNKENSNDLNDDTIILGTNDYFADISRSPSNKDVSLKSSSDDAYNKSCERYIISSSDEEDERKFKVSGVEEKININKTNSSNQKNEIYSFSKKTINTLSEKKKKNKSTISTTVSPCNEYSSILMEGSNQNEANFSANLENVFMSYKNNFTKNTSNISFNNNVPISNYDRHLKSNKDRQSCSSNFLNLTEHIEEILTQSYEQVDSLKLSEDEYERQNKTPAEMKTSTDYLSSELQNLITEYTTPSLSDQDSRIGQFSESFEELINISDEELEYSSITNTKKIINEVNIVNKVASHQPCSTPLRKYSSFTGSSSPKSNLCFEKNNSESNITPKRKVTIKTKNITPMPNYDTYSTPQIVKELGKLGLKPLKRRRGVDLLKYIYDTTHPVVEMKNSLINENMKKVRHSGIEVVARNALDVPHTVKPIEPWVGTILDSNIIFEKQRSSKTPTCQIPLDIVWHNFLVENPQIRENILLYEPLQVEVIHKMLKELGFRFQIQDLLTFLDRKCITIRVCQNGKTKR